MIAYKDPKHPGNAIRKEVVCMGCGCKGCTTAWGPWCFECNVKRIDRIDAQLQAAFPKRCETGDGDHFNMDCLWCGAPLGGVCQNR